MGALGPALRRAASARISDESLWQSLTPKIAYVCLMSWFIGLVVIFLMFKIIPLLEKIVKEFGIALPSLTLALIDVAQCAGQWGFLFFPLILVLAAVPFYAALRYSGAIHWDFPGMGWLMRRLDEAAILDALALAPANDRPVLPALVALAETYPKGRIRRRLRFVAHDATAGADWCESLYRRGLIGRANLAVFQAAARVGNLAWAMREMAESNRRRFVYHTEALMQILFPLVVLAFGAVVMFIVVAMYLPLITLIFRLV
jgi:type IV pilus assembly protein PilC